MYRNYVCQVAKTITIEDLPEHYGKQLIPTAKMLDVFVPFVFRNKSLKIFLRKKLDRLNE